MGCITPCGSSVELFWESLTLGRSGIGRISRFDSGPFDVHVAGEVPGFQPHDHGIGPKDARRLDLFALYALAAARQALVEAGFSIDGESVRGLESTRAGVVIGTGMGGLGSIERQSEVFQRSGPARVSPTLVPSAVPDVAANEIALRYRLRGPSMAVTTACSSGNDALICAARLIRDGTVDVAVAGGAEATVTPLSIATFGNLQALAKGDRDPTTACRPFDRDRCGFVMGEGAGVLILESKDHACRRGAYVHAVLAGYGQSSDAYHRTAPDPHGWGAARAMTQALDMANVQPREVDYVNAHGTSTLANDAMETRALKRALGDADAYRVPISSTKSMTGHLIGAAGAVEAIATVQAMRSGTIPPTLNLDHADIDCDLDYVPKRARAHIVRVAISNTFGFGGHNATLLFRAP
jgi:3-oxoacyl-[acyl-carrier-protein] synthase II